MAGNLHKIQQQHVTVQFDGIENTTGIQNEIVELFNEELLPKLELLFDDTGNENYLVSIDSLEIDCGILSAKNWKRELIDEALRKIKAEISTSPKKEIKKAAADDLDETLLYFAETGLLLWNSDIKHVKELEKAELSELLIKKLKALLNEDMQAAMRLASWFSAEIFKSLLNLLARDRIDELSRIYFLLTKYKIPASDTVDTKAALLRAFSDGKGHALQLFFSYLYTEVSTANKRLINEIVDDEKLPPVIPDLTARRKKDKEPDFVYVNNAGMVILHPFLPHLFKDLGLLTDEGWKNKEAQHKAVYILQFLVTGSDREPEFELPLNKLICGLDITDALNPPKKLSVPVKKECEQLLDAVIANWSMLRNTSHAGLRETFLQRSGKLTQLNNGWQLKVEQKGVDVLLNSLPWGNGVVKQPWIEKILLVE